MIKSNICQICVSPTNLGCFKSHGFDTDLPWISHPPWSPSPSPLHDTPILVDSNPPPAVATASLPRRALSRGGRVQGQNEERQKNCVPNLRVPVGSRGFSFRYSRYVYMMYLRYICRMQYMLWCLWIDTRNEVIRHNKIYYGMDRFLDEFLFQGFINLEWQMLSQNPCRYSSYHTKPWTKRLQYVKKKQTPWTWKWRKNGCKTRFLWLQKSSFWSCSFCFFGAAGLPLKQPG